VTFSVPASKIGTVRGSSFGTARIERESDDGQLVPSAGAGDRVSVRRRRNGVLVARGTYFGDRGGLHERDSGLWSERATKQAAGAGFEPTDRCTRPRFWRCVLCAEIASRDSTTTCHTDPPVSGSM
jgi:hypothetical protein